MATGGMKRRREICDGLLLNASYSNNPDDVAHKLHGENFRAKVLLLLPPKRVNNAQA